MISYLDNPYFIFSGQESNSQFITYIYRDSSNYSSNLQSELRNIFDCIRKQIYRPEKIVIIIAENYRDILIKDLDLIEELSIRFQPKMDVNIYSYKEVCCEVLQKGIKTIVEEKKVDQESHPYTTFRKPSSRVSKHFIKASLALSDYPYISLIALCAYKNIERDILEVTRLEEIRTICIDTSAIFSFTLAFIEIARILGKKDFNPKIINFKSYSKGEIDFTENNIFTFISASSGSLQHEKNIKKLRCITLFYAGDKEDYKYVYKLEFNKSDAKGDKREIPVTTEDFSISYSKSKEFILCKPDVEDKKEYRLIKEILSYHSDAIPKYPAESSIAEFKFSDEELYKHQKSFLKNRLYRVLTKKWNNHIIYDEYTKNLIEGEGSTLVRTFLDDNVDWPGGDNIVILLNQATKGTLTSISTELRQKEAKNVNYIVGTLLTNDFGEIRYLKNNITFNNTDEKYNYFCKAELPILDLDCSRLSYIAEFKLTDGLVFYEKDNASNFNPVLVYIAFYLIFEIMRYVKKLEDNIT